MTSKQSQAQRYGRTEADHGKLVDCDGHKDWWRWCHTCDTHHGEMYACEHYPRWVLMEIQKEDSAYRDNLIERWESGDRSTELVISMALAGLSPE